jgi:hypothetical protein
VADPLGASTGLQPLPPQIPSDGAHRGADAANGGQSFFEPVSGQWVSRTGTQPLPQWIRALPDTEAGLSMLDRWQGSSSPEALVAQTESQLRQQIAIPSTSPAADLLGPSVVDQINADGDNIKIGYAMGSLAAEIDQRIAAHPDVPSANAAQFSAALKQQSIALSHGAASQATADPEQFTYNGQCYPNANAMAVAVQRNQASMPQLRAYTPEMQQRDQIAAMDRAVMGQDNPLGMSWGQTIYMYARGNGADADGLRRAYAGGTMIDAGLGVAGSFAAAGAARDGMALPGGQTNPIVSEKGRPVTTEPTVRLPAEAPPAAPVRTSAADLAAYRSRINVPDTQTVAVGKTDIPGLRGATFEGASPKVLREAGLPQAEKGPIAAPNKNPLFTRHAEEMVANQFAKAVDARGLTAADLAGRTLDVRVSQPVCSACKAGLADPTARSGVLKQLSERYPTLEIRVGVDGSADSFTLQAGKIVGR